MKIHLTLGLYVVDQTVVELKYCFQSFFISKSELCIYLDISTSFAYPKMQKKKQQKKSNRSRLVLHHYVQLFYLWFPPPLQKSIINILLRTIMVIKRICL